MYAHSGQLHFRGTRRTKKHFAVNFSSGDFVDRVCGFVAMFMCEGLKALLPRLQSGHEMAFYTTYSTFRHTSRDKSVYLISSLP